MIWITRNHWVEYTDVDVEPWQTNLENMADWLLILLMFQLLCLHFSPWNGCVNSLLWSECRKYAVLVPVRVRAGCQSAPSNWDTPAGSFSSTNNQGLLLAKYSAPIYIRFWTGRVNKFANVVLPSYSNLGNTKHREVMAWFNCSTPNKIKWSCLCEHF